MIAQVITVEGQGNTDNFTDEVREFTRKTLDDAVTHDGVEANVVLRDPNTGDIVIIGFFRDQAALDAFQEFSHAKKVESEEIEGETTTFSSDRVYSEVIAAQAASSTQ